MTGAARPQCHAGIPPHRRTAAWGRFSLRDALCRYRTFHVPSGDRQVLPPMISRMRSASIPPGPIRSFTFFPVMIYLLDDNVLSAGRSSRLPVLIPGTVDLTEQGGDILPVFLHMELQQPDDKAGDAATTGGPDQHGDPAVQSPINVGGLPLSGSGSGNQNLLLYSSGPVYFPCPDLTSMTWYLHHWFQGWETGADRRFPVSPTLSRTISESRFFSFSESIF